MVDIQALEAITDAFDRHDVDAIMSFFSDDATFDAPRGRDPHGTRFVGKDAIAGAFQGRFEGLPDVRYLDGRHFVSGDRGAVRVAAHGDHARWHPRRGPRLRPLGVPRR